MIFQSRQGFIDANITGSAGALPPD